MTDTTAPDAIITLDFAGNVNWRGIAALEPFLVDVDQLTELPSNYREHDIPAIAGSLAEFGQRKPIVARITTRPNAKRPHGIIEAGHGTLGGALHNGWKRVAVVWVREDETGAKRYAVADNRTHDLGTDNGERLTALLDELRESSANALDGTGWTPPDIELLRNSLTDRQAELEALRNRGLYDPAGALPTFVVHAQREQIDALRSWWDALPFANNDEKIKHVVDQWEGVDDPEPEPEP